MGLPSYGVRPESSRAGPKPAHSQRLWDRGTVPGVNGVSAVFSLVDAVPAWQSLLGLVEIGCTGSSCATAMVDKRRTSNKRGERGAWVRGGRFGRWEKGRVLLELGVISKWATVGRLGRQNAFRPTGTAPIHRCCSAIHTFRERSRKVNVIWSFPIAGPKLLAPSQFGAFRLSGRVVYRESLADLTPLVAGSSACSRISG